MAFIQQTQLDEELKIKLKKYVYEVLGCCIDVRKELGCWLNEYMYQDALAIALRHKNIKFIKEFRFYTTFQGEKLGHYHQVDFLIKDNIYLECKAVQALGPEQRQQLWNYLRLSKIRIGILYNFAPMKDQCEKYYYNPDNKTIGLF